MQSSRQKKRTSLQKKRYHERAKKAGSAEPSAEKTLKVSTDTETVVPTRKTTSKVFTDGQSEELGLYGGADNIEDKQRCSVLVQGNVKKKESVPQEEETRRKQEELEEERKKEEEQLQQRLLQLLSMPIQHDPLPQPPVTTSTSASLSSSILTLDWTSLADSLSTLPLHDRLNIDRSLLEFDDLTHVEEPSGTYITAEDEALLRNKIDLTVCSKRNKPEKFEFDKMMSKLKLEKDKDGQVGENRGLAGAASSQLVVGKASNEDVELQMLLNNKVSVGTGLSSCQSLASSTVATPPTTDREVSNLSVTSRAYVEGVGIASTSTSTANSDICLTDMNEPVATDTIGTLAEDTDELDDLLDELLS